MQVTELTVEELKILIQETVAETIQSTQNFNLCKPSPVGRFNCWSQFISR